MKRYLNVAIGLLSLFLLSGCFGEDYDFSPPTVMVITPNGIDIQEALAEANIDWKYDDKYNKETEDIQELAEMQNIIYFEPRELVALNMENGTFDPNKIKVSVLQNENKIELEYFIVNQTFNLPTEKGKYILVVDIETDKGNAQYVDNIAVQ
ncbi:hypothetical protein MHH37_11925 [Solibacillus sp. FSL K6-1781]|uniref:hypothetical protein n=1 Tax=Solibacillus sp. FSL K6-1781 TaxID=2921474 RepID=UPI00315AFA63